MFRHRRSDTCILCSAFQPIKEHEEEGSGQMSQQLQGSSSPRGIRGGAITPTTMSLDQAGASSDLQTGAGTPGQSITSFIKKRKKQNQFLSPNETPIRSQPLNLTIPEIGDKTKRSMSFDLPLGPQPRDVRFQQPGSKSGTAQGATDPSGIGVISQKKQGTTMGRFFGGFSPGSLIGTSGKRTE